jgi:solute carrier family 25 folate transporter 32
LFQSLRARNASSIREADQIFYRLAPNIVRVLPSTCVTFLVYENTKFYLPTFFGEEEAAYDLD